MAKENSLSGIITVFVLLLLGLVLIVVIADQTNLNIEKTAVVNEVVDISGAVLDGGAINTTYPLYITNIPTSWKVEDCPISDFVIGNSTTDFTVTTDYTFTATTGAILLKNTAAVNTSNAASNNSVVDYKYCSDNYINSSWGRTILGTNVGIVAIAILIIIIAFAYVMFGKKEEDY